MYCYRFTREEREKRHQMAHMPFGWGPRSCIGMRLALMEAKMALVAVLHHYKLVEGPDTQKVNSNHVILHECILFNAPMIRS